jgi:DeoR family transcriptional regulator, aga operon transcriptional repressor
MEIDGRKSTVERRGIILEQLNSIGQVNVSELSEKLGVSEVTIRNDLANLEKKNLLVRARGGALKTVRVGLDFELSEKGKKYSKEKQLIGKAAASLVEDGDTIVLDSGTTTFEVAKNLTSYKDLTIMTNALNIARMLADYENVRVMMPGGYLRKKSLSLVGAPAEETFRNYYCDKLFLAVDGFDTAQGLSTPNVEEAHINKVMIEISRQVIVVTDSSKFLRRSFAFICGLENIDVVITDSNIPSEDKRILENANIKVIIAT